MSTISIIGTGGMIAEYQIEQMLAWKRALAWKR
jgi:hypothetical protein